MRSSSWFGHYVYTRSVNKIDRETNKNNKNTGFQRRFLPTLSDKVNYNSLKNVFGSFTFQPCAEMFKAARIDLTFSASNL